MRLVTFRADDGEPHVGIIRDGEIIDLTLWLPYQEPVLLADFDMVDLIAAPREVWSQVEASLEASEIALKGAGALVPFQPEELLAPIPRPRKNVFCIGRNYAEHAAESIRAHKEAPPTTNTPQYPAVFTKAPTAVIGPYDDIPFNPNISEQMDFEGELAIVIGRTGKTIQRSQALSHVFGYMVLNDITARDIQKRHVNQFFKGKSLDGSCPTGPWIVTADEIPNPDDLELWTRVNGVEKQHDTTASMLLDVAGIIEAVSFGLTLEPGDIIATGTPAGVGFARDPAEFLRPGDVVECEIEGIGAIRNRVMRET
ncbi:MAG TPA: fumarylacetoacetate hydrolase family protein [Chloroflexia bacterium]|nr:fumarylacetoacetate hydrolase family protein [Chloroflexia bacterium]